MMHDVGNPSSSPIEFRTAAEIFRSLGMKSNKKYSHSFKDLVEIPVVSTMFS